MTSLHTTRLSLAAALLLRRRLRPGRNACQACRARGLKKPVAAAAVAAQPPELSEAGDEQLAAFQAAHLGDYNCEFKPNRSADALRGQARLRDRGLEQTALRDEARVSRTPAPCAWRDVTGRTLMIQIANKSMLLDVKVGQRLVDDRIHPRAGRHHGHHPRRP